MWRVAPPRVCLTMEAHSSTQGAPTAQTQGAPKMPELAAEDLRIRKHLHEVFLTAVEAVMPKSLLAKVIHFNPNIQTLTVKDRTYTVKRNVFVVGFGKGVVGMAQVVEELLGEHIIRGILSVPTGAKDDYQKAGKQDMTLREGSKISMQEGAANNLPDSQALHTATDIHRLVSNLTQTDIVIVLISGGGSALLPYPRDPLDLNDVVTTTKELFSRGAPIADVNVVRTHLEVLKGGGLARAAMPAQVISLIISDVIGDSLELIASGPTVQTSFSPMRCLEIIDRFNAKHAMPPKVMEFLENGKMLQTAQSKLTADPRGGMTEGRPMDRTDWTRVHNVVVGSNSVGCTAAAHCAEQMGFVTCILTHSLSGEARMAGQLLANLAQFLSACYQSRGRTGDKHLVRLELDMAAQGISKDKLNEISSKASKAHNTNKSICLVAGGETTVNITGAGKGGRNQELVLAAGIQLQKGFMVYRERKARASVFFLSAGTDGQDGPTDAAGAVVDENFVVDASSQGLDPNLFLHNNDSYALWHQFAGGRDHVTIGLTGTNVMDIHLLILSGVQG
ncbi:hypothetical protein ACOMHN_043373 [Nucella lapillus]